MPYVNERQRDLIIGSVHGQVENCQESVRGGMSARDLGIDLPEGQELGWEDLVEHGKKTVLFVLRQNGSVQSLADEGYVSEEEEEDLSNLDVEEVVSFIEALKGVYEDGRRVIR